MADENIYEEPAQFSDGNIYEIMDPVAVESHTSITSDYDDISIHHPDTDLAVESPAQVDSQNCELPPKRRNIYSNMSDGPLLHASSYEEPVRTPQVW